MFGLSSTEKTSALVEGNIAAIVRQKGYGFVRNNADERVFFHQRWLSGVRFRDLNVGDRVAFRLEKGPRGFRARELQRSGQSYDQSLEISGGRVFRREALDRVEAGTTRSASSGLRRQLMKIIGRN